MAETPKKKKAAGKKKTAKTSTTKKTAKKAAAKKTTKKKAAKKSTTKKAAAKKTTKKKAAAKKTTKKKAAAGDEAVELKPGAGTGKALVVVESPAKAKTINKFLGKDFHVMASMGHVRDLPKSELGIDLDHGFEPIYEPLPEKKKVISELRRGAKNARAIYLACDMDREGEAIAWHINELLKAKSGITQRVTFNQITEAAIKRAFEQPRALDMNKVNAQQARRILDRIVGYKLSQLLWKKVRFGLSAGRVQSVAMKMVVEREQEIRAFVPVEYWEFAAEFDSPRLQASMPAPQLGPDEPPPWRFATKLVKLTADGEEQKLDPDGFHIGSKEEAQALVAQLMAAAFQITKVEQRERRNNPKAPFITSTLQQAASSELGFGAKKTMRIAQSLYEGVDVGGDGAVGLITYMRTDSVNLAPEAVAECRGLIERAYGSDYLPAEPVVHKRGKMKVQAQEAHEAIRPTSALREPDQIANHLNADQLKLYRLIWRRFVACQMKPARFMAMTVEVTSQDERQAVFRATGQRLLFDGHLRVGGRAQTDRLLPDLQEGEAASLHPPLEPEQKFTKPPARFNESSLIKRLEDEGIGRPSTYASIIDTIQKRGYVEAQNRALHATRKGEVICGKLGRFFHDIMDYGYTRKLEEDLDRVEGAFDEEDSESGTSRHLDALEWRDLLEDFYQGFSKDLSQADEKMSRVNDDAELTDHECPKCGAKMKKIWNTNEFTQFLGCSNYPECKSRIPLGEDGEPAPEQPIAMPCPKCGKELVRKSGKRGPFVACSGYPDCKQTMEIGEDGQPVAPPDVHATCPESDCDEELIVRRGRRGPFLGCPRYPKCRGTLPIFKDAEGNWQVGERAKTEDLPEVDVKCERCGSPMKIKRSARGPFLGCSAYPKCRATAKLPEDVELPPPPKPQEFGEDCEQCGKPLVIREGRRGPFVACSGYPACKNTRNISA